MKVITWSQNLTDEKASAAGATLVNKRGRFARRMSDGAPELPLMKQTASLVNTSRNLIVDEGY